MNTTNNKTTKPNCHECKHRRTIPGSAHSRCDHPSNANTDSLAFEAMAILASAGRISDFQVQTSLHIKGNPTGMHRGWFNWPYNFDPTWLLECDGFEEKATQ